ncbi:MAG: hypothetical protein Kow00120_16500 [Anaerolineae bacterium]
MADELRDMIDIDRIIHEPARMVIVTILNAVERADFLYLQRETGLTKGNLSSHLTRLEDAGYVTIEKTFEGKTPRTTCRLTDQGRAAFKAYRERLQRAIDAAPAPPDA